MSELDQTSQCATLVIARRTNSTPHSIFSLLTVFGNIPRLCEIFISAERKTSCSCYLLNSNKYFIFPYTILSTVVFRNVRETEKGRRGGEEGQPRSQEGRFTTLTIVAGIPFHFMFSYIGQPETCCVHVTQLKTDVMQVL